LTKAQIGNLRILEAVSGRVYHWKHGWIPLDHGAADEAKAHMLDNTGAIAPAPGAPAGIAAMRDSKRASKERQLDEIHKTESGFSLVNALNNAGFLTDEEAADAKAAGPPDRPRSSEASRVPADAISRMRSDPDAVRVETAGMSSQEIRDEYGSGLSRPLTGQATASQVGYIRGLARRDSQVSDEVAKLVPGYYASKKPLAHMNARDRRADNLLNRLTKQQASDIISRHSSRR